MDPKKFYRKGENIFYHRNLKVFIVPSVKYACIERMMYMPEDEPMDECTESEFSDAMDMCLESLAEEVD